MQKLFEFSQTIRYCPTRQPTALDLLLSVNSAHTFESREREEAFSYRPGLSGSEILGPQTLGARGGLNLVRTGTRMEIARTVGPVPASRNTPENVEPMHVCRICPAGWRSPSAAVAATAHSEHWAPFVSVEVALCR